MFIETSFTDKTEYMTDMRVLGITLQSEEEATRQTILGVFKPDIKNIPDVSVISLGQFSNINNNKVEVFKTEIQGLDTSTNVADEFEEKSLENEFTHLVSEVESETKINESYTTDNEDDFFDEEDDFLSDVDIEKPNAEFFENNELGEQNFDSEIEDTTEDSEEEDELLSEEGYSEDELDNDSEDELEDELLSDEEESEDALDDESEDEEDILEDESEDEMLSDEEFAEEDELLSEEEDDYEDEDDLTSEGLDDDEMLSEEDDFDNEDELLSKEDESDEESLSTDNEEVTEFNNVVNKATSSQVYNNESNSIIDKDEDVSFEELSKGYSGKSDLLSNAKKIISERNEEPIESKEGKKEIPPDIVNYLKLYPYSDIKEVAKYYPKKDIEMAVLTGRVFKLKNKLYI